MRIISPAEKSFTQSGRNPQHAQPTDVPFGSSRIPLYQHVARLRLKNHISPKAFSTEVGNNWLVPWTCVISTSKVCSRNDTSRKKENLHLWRSLSFPTVIPTSKALYDQSEGSYSDLMSVSPSSTLTLMEDLLMRISLPFEVCVFLLRIRGR